MQSSLEDEPGNPGVQVRVIREAVLREFSSRDQPRPMRTPSVDLRGNLRAQRAGSDGNIGGRRIWL